VGTCSGPFQQRGRQLLFHPFHPPFWFGAITNQVRVFLALGSAALMIGRNSFSEAEPMAFGGL
jgi:hypothetical protein